MVSELEFRSAQVADVSFPKRQIELIVMPYESATLVEHHGRMIEEIVSRGAYDGIEERNGQIRVNRDHQVERTVGRALRFYPSRQEGLIAELRIARTHLGEETLQLAGEDCLDASAGFALLFDKKTGRVKPGAEVWETRDRRRLNHLWLGHIGLTPEPAYTTAKVLAVRSNIEPEESDLDKPATPRLDMVRAQRLEERWRQLDAVHLGR